MSDPVGKKLYDAADKGRVSKVTSLLRNHPGLNVNWTNPTNQWTPLHAASFQGCAEVVKLLLAHPDINVNLKNVFGQTPFSLACLPGQVSVVQLLLKDPGVDIALEDRNGCTPLWHASWYGSMK